MTPIGACVDPEWLECTMLAGVQARGAEELAIFERLGEWAAGIEAADIPAPAGATATRSIIDYVAVTLAATREPLADVVRRYLGSESDGPARVVGLGSRGDAQQVAMANGALSHALDFDDVSHTMGGHPTVPVLSALLPVAQAQRRTGEEIHTAFCVGVEVETKIGRGLNFRHYDLGWHPTATLGTFGSAAAVAKLMGLDAERIGVALGLASAAASGLKSSFGTMAKPLQVGKAAQSGVQCAELAAAGATANLGAMEAKQGFARVFNGPDEFVLDRMTRSLGDPWDLEDPGIAIKLHPCCGGTHAAVDAAITLHEQFADIEEIDSVDAYIHARRYAHLDRPNPSGPLDAKFSLQHVVALALLQGEIRIADFDDQQLLRTDVVALRGRTSAGPLPAEREGPEHFAAEVHLNLRDGTVLKERMERPRGRSPETALTDEDIRRKFDACVERCLGEQDRTSVYQLLSSIIDHDDSDLEEGLWGPISTSQGGST